MNKDLLFLLAAGAAVVVMSKKATAAPIKAAGPAGSAATSVNNQLWTSILGGAWTSLLDPSSGNSGFLMTNNFGQVVTSDGKPVNSSLPAISAALSNTDYSSGYTGISDPVSAAAPDGTDWLSKLGW